MLKFKKKLMVNTHTNVFSKKCIFMHIIYTMQTTRYNYYLTNSTRRIGMFTIVHSYEK